MERDSLLGNPWPDGKGISRHGGRIVSGVPRLLGEHFLRKSLTVLMGEPFSKPCSKVDSP